MEKANQLGKKSFKPIKTIEKGQKGYGLKQIA